VDKREGESVTNSHLCLSKVPASSSSFTVAHANFSTVARIPPRATFFFVYIFVSVKGWGWGVVTPFVLLKMEIAQSHSPCLLSAHSPHFHHPKIYFKSLSYTHLACV